MSDYIKPLENPSEALISRENQKAAMKNAIAVWRKRFNKDIANYLAKTSVITPVLAQDIPALVMMPKERNKEGWEKIRRQTGKSLRFIYISPKSFI